MNPNRRQLILGASALALPALVLAQAKTPLPPLQVWKDPDCGCCNDWVAYLRADGFTVARSTLRPSALETTFCAITITSSLRG